MQYFCEDWPLDLVRRDRDFLRIMGIRPCLLPDPCPKPPPASFADGFEDVIRFCDMTHIRTKERRVRLTKNDAEWLKAIGAAWKKQPALQLPLDFSEHP